MSNIPFRTGVAYAIALTFFGSAAVADTTMCSTTTACTVVQNTGSGVALHAQTISGTALRANSSSGAGIYAGTLSGKISHPGIDGENTGSPDVSEGGSAAALFGFTAVAGGLPAPTIAIYSYGISAGFEGFTTATGADVMHFGVAAGGLDPSTAATDYNAGVDGESKGSGLGVYGSSGGAAGPGFASYGTQPIGVYALGASPGNNPKSSVGLFSESDNVGIDSHNTSVGSVVLANTPTNLISGSVMRGGSFSIDNSGNEVLSGTLTTPGNVIHIAKGADGATRAAYGARTTAPDVEDIGQATILDGRGYVRIDAALRNSIDQRNAYLVFLTPEGDCNGLYVAHKSPDGFEIRELRGGRSSLAVDYRIAAKPLGENAQRLAAVALPLAAADHDVRSTRREGPRLVSPIERMRATLSPAAYAKVVQEAKERLSAPDSM